jgi:hypothetical protein
MSYTRGPWRQNPKDPKYIQTDEDIGSDIARVLWLGDDREANAHLIAAAPDLLEVAKRSRARLWGADEGKGLDEQLREAIRKAEGHDG